MKLQVGLFEHSIHWEELLTQEGVPWTVIDAGSQEINRQCSALIVNRPLSRAERDTVEQYLKSGGGVLGYARDFSDVAGSRCRPERIEYLLNDDHSPFPGIQLMDVAREGCVSSEANRLRTQSNSPAVLAGELGGGVAVLLPFDVGDVMNDHRAATKNFYFTQERLPAERTSRISKGEIRYLIKAGLEFLHSARGIPYVHTWYFPEGNRNLFALRIDTDGAPRMDIDTLHGIACSHDIGMSWFLDVKSHEKWLHHFSTMSRQEMGVHCYEHRTYPTYEENLNNLRKARHIMETSGIPSYGMTAPFGIWNEGLAKAIDELGFEYSSEFSFAYDNLPIYPTYGSTRSKALQIPIHPICIGSLLKVGYSESKMIDYFRWVARQKFLKNEPLFFYHHPSHKHWQVIESLVTTMKDYGISHTTFVDFARWWKHRLACHFSIELQGETLLVDGGTAKNADIRLHISYRSREAMVLPLRRIDLSGLSWSISAKDILPPDDIRRMREFDLRTTIAGLYTTIQRKLQ